MQPTTGGGKQQPEGKEEEEPGVCAFTVAWGRLVQKTGPSRKMRLITGGCWPSCLEGNVAGRGRGEGWCDLLRKKRNGKNWEMPDKV